MEPLFFKAENQIDDCAIAHGERASMEPLFFKAENPSGTLPRYSVTLAASMEPLFFKAENRPSGQLRPRQHAGLQWSRFFSKRKMIRRPGSTRLAVGFNGAAFFQSGKYVVAPDTGPTAIRASMEPLFFKAENTAGKGWQAPLDPRFNGAAFFQSGKSPDLARMVRPN